MTGMTHEPLITAVPSSEDYSTDLRLSTAILLVPPSDRHMSEQTYVTC
jgi:hypothetical protein